MFADGLESVLNISQMVSIAKEIESSSNTCVFTSAFEGWEAGSWEALLHLVLDKFPHGISGILEVTYMDEPVTITGVLIISHPQ